MSKLNSVLVAIGALMAAIASGSASAAPGPVDVKVVNTPPRQPFVITRSCVTGGKHYCSIPKISVPADKVLVIEHVSMGGSNMYDQQAAVQISVEAGGEPANFWVPAILTKEGQNWLFESLRIYSDAGSGVTLSAFFPDSVNGDVAMSLSGYFVDCATEYLCGAP
jgi:hypothetical protein